MIIIDSNIWIFSENTNVAEHEAAARKVKETIDSDTFGINTIIASEAYHILSKYIGSKDAGHRITDILEHPLSQWLDFTAEMVSDAIKLAYSSSMRINDALIAQQALKLRATVLTDNVRDFKKVKGLEIIPLR